MSSSALENYIGLKRATPTLPSSWYIDPKWYARDLENIFYRSWIYLCHESTLSENRSFRTFTIGDQGVFLLRDDNSKIRGYFNTCRHRGSQLCTEARGKFPSRLITCPYHQWSYSFDGKLRATSSRAEAPDFKKENYPLFSINVETWRGGIFVCLSDTPPSIEESFARGGDKIKNWPMKNLVVGHRWHKKMECNWKTFWENFNECLHCPNIHPELSEIVPMYGRRITQPADDPGWQKYKNNPDPKYQGGLRRGADTWSVDGKPLQKKFRGLTDEEIQRGQTFFVSLPSVYMAAHVDYMRTVRILPVAPEQTEISVEWLFEKENLENPDMNMDNITDFAKLVMTQDAQASEMNQRGMRSKVFDRGVLMPEEHYVEGFQSWIRRMSNRNQSDL